MKNQCRATYALRRFLDIDIEHRPQAQCCHFWRRRQSLVFIEVTLLLLSGVGHEFGNKDLPECLPPCSPPQRGNFQKRFGFFSDFWIQVSSGEVRGRIATKQNQLTHALRMPGGVSHRDGRATGDSQKRKFVNLKRVGHGLQILHPGIQRNVSGAPV